MCLATGRIFDAVPAPSAVILDVMCMINSDTIINWPRLGLLFFYSYFQLFALPQLHATRAVSGHSVPIIAGIILNAATVIRMFGPESIGGLGDFAARIDAEDARTRMSPEENGDKVL